MEVLRSLREFTCMVLRTWHGLIVAGVGGALGFVDLIADDWYAAPPCASPASPRGALNIPRGLWIAIIVIGLALAAFGAFHRVRRQRDALPLDHVAIDPVSECVFDAIGDVETLSIAYTHVVDEKGSRTKLRVEASRAGSRRGDRGTRARRASSEVNGDARCSNAARQAE